MAGPRGRQNGSAWILRDRRLAIYARDSFACVYCLASEASGATLTLDHWQPRQYGGSHETRNLLTSCMSCNSMRGVNDFADFLRSLRRRGITTRGLLLRIWAQLEAPIDRQLGKRIAIDRYPPSVLTFGSDEIRARRAAAQRARRARVCAERTA